MSDIFVSYARPNEGLAKQAADALREAGYSVWRDDELPAPNAIRENPRFAAMLDGMKARVENAHSPEVSR